MFIDLNCLMWHMCLLFWFFFGLQYWNMGVSPRDDVSHTFMIPIQFIDLRPQIKFKGFMIWLYVVATAFLSFDIMILSLAHECITIVQCVASIHDLCMTMTFDLNIKIIYFHHEFYTDKIIFAL